MHSPPKALVEYKLAAQYKIIVVRAMLLDQFDI